MKQLLVCFTLLVMALPAQAESAFDVGPGVFVIDGDTFRLADGRSVRLFGIDTPECAEGQWRDGHCDRAETGMLTVLLTAGPVSCIRMDTDHYNRIVGRCMAAAGIDLGERLVRVGLARAAYWNGHHLVHGEGIYADAERQAIADGTGYWKCGVETPPRFRAIKRKACPGV